MTSTVSLMVFNANPRTLYTLGNGWTVVTRDGRCSAHFEHTLAIVKGGCEVLTKTREPQEKGLD